MATFEHKLRDVMDRGVSLAKENPNVCYGVAGGTALLCAWSLYSRKRSYKKKPTSFDLGGGSIGATEVSAEFANYSNAYGDEAGEGIREAERGNVVQLVRSGLCMRSVERQILPNLW